MQCSSLYASRVQPVKFVARQTMLFKSLCMQCQCSAINIKCIQLYGKEISCSILPDTSLCRVHKKSSLTITSNFYSIRKRIYFLYESLTLFIILKKKQVSGDDGGHCIWYGECFQDSFLHKKNCFYDGPAKPLSSEGQKILAKRCPHLMVDNGQGINTCCDEKQLMTLDSNINIASNFLKRCPSCLDNLIKHICDFTCAVNQNQFINVTKTAEENGNYSHFVSSLLERNAMLVYSFTIDVPMLLYTLRFCVSLCRYEIH